MRLSKYDASSPHRLGVNKGSSDRDRTARCKIMHNFNMNCVILHILFCIWSTDKNCTQMWSKSHIKPDRKHAILHITIFSETKPKSMFYIRLEDKVDVYLNCLLTGL